MIGTVVEDRYKVEAQIGAGGMGVVYRARDTRLQRDVALKSIAPHLLSEPDARRKFQREAHVLAGLSHPNIVTIYDLIEPRESDVFIIVMELLRGHSLRDFPAPGTRPRLEEIATAVCRALDHAHSHQVLHRDIKPDNVFVNSDGPIKLMDFGLSQLYGSSSRHSVNAIAGTIAYMAPEQLRGASMDPRSDLYSLGVVMYELAAGANPFEAETPAATLMRHLNFTPQPPECKSEPLSSGITRIIMRLIEKEPAKRYQSAKEVLADLESPGDVKPARARLDFSAVQASDQPAVAVAPDIGTVVPAVIPGSSPQDASQIEASNAGTSRRPRRGIFLSVAAVGCTLGLIGWQAFGRSLWRPERPQSPHIALMPVSRHVDKAPVPEHIPAAGVIREGAPRPPQQPPSPAVKSQPSELVVTPAVQALIDSAIKKRDAEFTAELERRLKQTAATPTAPSTRKSDSQAAPDTTQEKAIPAPSGTVASQANASGGPGRPGGRNRTRRDFNIRVRLPQQISAPGPLSVEVHNDRDCYLYFYGVWPARNPGARSIAIQLSPGPEHLVAAAEKDKYSMVSLTGPGSLGARPPLLVWLASRTSIERLPSRLPVPPIPAIDHPDFNALTFRTTFAPLLAEHLLHRLQDGKAVTGDQPLTGENTLIWMTLIPDDHRTHPGTVGPPS